MLEYDQRDSIIATALTPEMHVKLHRLRVASGMDPLLRQQDARAGLEKTFRARQLKGNWYEVSLGEPSGARTHPPAPDPSTWPLHDRLHHPTLAR